jgi:hypothetical protein
MNSKRNNIFCYIEYTGKIISDPFVSSKDIAETYYLLVKQLDKIKNIKKDIYSNTVFDIKKNTKKLLTEIRKCRK